MISVSLLGQIFWSARNSADGTACFFLHGCHHCVLRVELGHNFLLVGLLVGHNFFLIRQHLLLILCELRCQLLLVHVQVRGQTTTQLGKLLTKQFFQLTKKRMRAQEGFANQADNVVQLQRTSRRKTCMKRGEINGCRRTKGEQTKGEKKRKKGRVVNKKVMYNTCR